MHVRKNLGTRTCLRGERYEAKTTGGKKMPKAAARYYTYVAPQNIDSTPQRVRYACIGQCRQQRTAVGARRFEYVLLTAGLSAACESRTAVCAALPLLLSTAQLQQRRKCTSGMLYYDHTYSGVHAASSSNRERWWRGQVNDRRLRQSDQSQ